MSTDATPATPAKPDPKAAALAAEIKKLEAEKAEIEGKQARNAARLEVVNVQLAALNKAQK